MAMSHSVCLTSFSLCNTICGGEEEQGLKGFNTRSCGTAVNLEANVN